MAGAVLAFAICTSILVIQASLREAGLARNVTAVAQAMQNEMDRLRLLNWSELSALPASGTVDLGATYTAATTVPGLTITRAVADVAGYGSPATLKEITLTARWTSTVDGMVRTRRFVLRYGKNGLYDYYYNGSG